MHEFTLEEARDVLAAIRSFAPDELRIPMSLADLRVVLDAGVEVKSQTDGLLDFPTTVDGEAAYWCWRAGEDDIAWWHPRSTGFAGRRPVPGH
ncbi:MAG: DUF2203 family protein [Dehalococcoidia bacterium]